MRYNKIRKMDISNGPGVRVAIFVQGCTFKCPGCFNPETHDFKGGQEFTQETIDKILTLCGHEYIKGLSILGGEPMHPQNIYGTFTLAKAFKEKFPGKTLWVWTGFLFEDLRKSEIFDCIWPYIDVMVDGQFKQELANPMLQYKGSSNQRVIDVQKSCSKKQVVFWQE